MYQVRGIEQFCKGHNPFPSCIEKISTILTNEGLKRNLWFNEETALNLDEVEKKVNPNARQQTYDFITVIKQNKLLLTEIKLRIDGIGTNLIDDVIGKVPHSKDLLVACPNFNNPFTLCGTMAVLIPDEQSETRTRKFRRLRIEKNAKLNIEAFTVAEYYKKFFEA